FSSCVVALIAVQLPLTADILARSRAGDRRSIAARERWTRRGLRRRLGALRRRDWARSSLSAQSNRSGAAQQRAAERCGDALHLLGQFHVQPDVPVFLLSRWLPDGGRLPLSLLRRTSNDLHKLIRPDPLGESGAHLVGSHR